MSQRRLKIHEHSKLLQQNGNGDVAVKREDPAILQAEYVAARRAHHLADARLFDQGPILAAVLR